MQNERPQKLDGPVPGCLVQLVGRKRILQHMRRAPHEINLDHNKTGPQGGNESLRRQKHTKRYARWLEAQGLPIDVTFFTNVDDELKSVEGWEDVHLSEDDQLAGHSTQADEDEDEDETPASSSGDDVPLIRPVSQRRKRYTIHEGEDDEEDRGLSLSGSNMDYAANQKENVENDHEPTDEGNSYWRPAGWAEDDKKSEMSTKARLKCPVPGCKCERSLRKRMYGHLRSKHNIPLSIYTGGNLDALRRKHAAEFGQWLEEEGYKVDVSFFGASTVDSQQATNTTFEDDYEEPGDHGDEEQEVPDRAETETHDNARVRQSSDKVSLDIPDDGKADHEPYHGDLAYMRLLRERLELFCDAQGQPTEVEFDIEHIAILICNVDDPAIDRWEGFCEQRRWTENDVEWIKTYVFKIVPQWRGAITSRHVIDELISQFNSVFQARVGLV
ncbi:hypothetical protein LTR78_007329 [Recurvomyces mirabilis]|uniref:Uncharacterized protein n=1 Tax=Recurvomyces mirabilis TaxID=574656 RepID=A0AAE0WJA1_9PEZI|nr:hypothetical protein LTR78_007329 [Recurvomyces mirabilis]KAK5155084.1 hypothetical protein LTS14_006039 [Recurvomyces mirabilis]